MGLNKVMVIGNLGKDAISRSVGERYAINMTVAVAEKYKSKDGETKETTEWFNVSYWTKSDAIAQYLKKGQTVYVEGSLRTEKYKDEHGEERSSVKLNATTVQLLGGRQQSNDNEDLPF